jgi:hypothetical protein
MLDLLLEYAAKKLIDAAALIAKDTLKGKIDERNKKALAEKTNRVNSLSPREVANLVLNDSEVSQGSISISTTEAYESLRDHVASIREWAAHIRFSDLSEKKIFSTAFR